jgi:preprotein translocase subunit SecG
MERVRRYPVLIAVAVLCVTTLVIVIMLQTGRPEVSGARTPSECAKLGGTWKWDTFAETRVFGQCE